MSRAGTSEMDARWADYSAERTASLAQEIAGLRPAVIITQGGGAQPATRLSPPIPVVFLQSGDPVEAGLADINRRTAAAMGLTVPPILLARADRVID